MEKLTEAEKRLASIERIEHRYGTGNVSPHAHRATSAQDLYRQRQAIGQPNPEVSYYPVWVYRLDDPDGSSPVVAHDEGELEELVSQGYARPDFSEPEPAPPCGRRGSGMSNAVTRPRKPSCSLHRRKRQPRFCRMN